MIPRKWVHVAIWVAVFFDGILDLLNLAPTVVSRLTQVAILALFGLTLLKRRVQYPFLPQVAVLTVVALISGLVVHDYSPWAVFAFLRQLILVPYAYFLIVFNERDTRITTAVGATIAALVALQIPAFVIKLILVGTTEDYIGTVALREGSMAAVITLIPAAFLFGRYLWLRRSADLAWIGVFLLLSQVNEKRAVIVYAPTLFILMYMVSLWLRGVRPVALLRHGVVFTALLLAVPYALIRLNPTMNPDKEVGGRFDLGYTIDYINFYNMERSAPGDVWEYSRVEALPHLARHLLRQSAEIVLFGEGAGKLTDANPAVPPETDPMQHYYGIRYGARVGIPWVYLQIGLLGVAAYVVLLLSIWRRVLRFPDASHHKLSVLGVLLVLVFDVFSYSMVTYRFFSIHGMFFAYLALYLSGGLSGHADRYGGERRPLTERIARPAPGQHGPYA